MPTLYGSFLHDKRQPDSGYPSYEPVPLRVNDALFHRCVFQDCFVGSVHWPEQAHRIENVQVERCTATMCTLRTAILDNVDVSHLAIKGGGRCNMLMREGCVFKHVVLRGNISGTLKLNIGPDFSMDLREKNDPTYRPRWNRFFQKFYQSVDWAIDISEAEFDVAPSFECLPGRLVRRDPDTQLLVTRKKALALNYKQLPWKGSIRVAIDWFIETNLFDDTVVIAPQRGRNRDREMADIQMMRSSGLAEPD